MVSSTCRDLFAFIRLNLRPGFLRAASLAVEDVFQEVQVKICERIDSFGGETDAEFCAWARVIVLLVIANIKRHHRCSKRDPSRVVSFEDLHPGERERIDAGEEPFERRLLETEELEGLKQAIGSLPERDALIIDLTYRQGLRTGEVASYLQLRPRTIQKRLGLSYGKLARQLQTHDGGLFVP